MMVYHWKKVEDHQQNKSKATVLQRNFLNKVTSEVHLSPQKGLAKWPAPQPLSPIKTLVRSPYQTQNWYEILRLKYNSQNV